MFVKKIVPKCNVFGRAPTPEFLFRDRVIGNGFAGGNANGFAALVKLVGARG